MSLLFTWNRTWLFVGFSLLVCMPNWLNVLCGSVDNNLNHANSTGFYDNGNEESISYAKIDETPHSKSSFMLDNVMQSIAIQPWWIIVLIFIGFVVTVCFSIYIVCVFGKWILRCFENASHNYKENKIAKSSKNGLKANKMKTNEKTNNNKNETSNERPRLFTANSNVQMPGFSSKFSTQRGKYGDWGADNPEFEPGYDSDELSIEYGNNQHRMILPRFHNNKNESKTNNNNNKNNNKTRNKKQKHNIGIKITENENENIMNVINFNDKKLMNNDIEMKSNLMTLTGVIDENEAEMDTLLEITTTATNDFNNNDNSHNDDKTDSSMRSWKSFTSMIVKPFRQKKNNNNNSNNRSGNSTTVNDGGNRNVKESIMNNKFVIDENLDMASSSEQGDMNINKMILKNIASNTSVKTINNDGDIDSETDSCTSHTSGSTSGVEDEDIVYQSNPVIVQDY